MINSIIRDILSSVEWFLTPKVVLEIEDQKQQVKEKLYVTLGEAGDGALDKFVNSNKKAH